LSTPLTPEVPDREPEPPPSPEETDLGPSLEREVDELSLLQSRLEQAVICEEYEEAARIRDEIESLVNKSKS